MARRSMARLAMMGMCAAAFTGERPAVAAPSGGARDVPVTVVTPIFGEVVKLTLPGGFLSRFEENKGKRYLLELVPEGETLEHWSQMITLSGADGLARNPALTPRTFAEGIAAGFLRVCPTSFSANGLGEFKLDGHEAYAVVLGCGIANPGVKQPFGESVLLLAIKGKVAFYTVQWAERGQASPKPMPYDEAKWAARMKRLSSVVFCPVVPGERPPYPSCVNRR